MAKVLFIANAVVNFTKFSFDSFYEGFINSLKRNGNEVYFLKANLFFDQDENSQNFQLNIKKEKLLKYIKNLEPELIITFNNNITKELLDNTACPVACFSSESYDFLVSKELIKKYGPRYLFLHFANATYKQFIDNLLLSRKNNIITFLATDVKAEKRKQDKNISFLGTIHGTVNELNLIKELITSVEQRQAISEFITKIKYTPLNIDDTTLENLNTKITKISLMNILSRYQRAKYLDELSDLGLHIYGGRKWLELFEFFPFLALSYKDNMVISLKETSNLYNASKISINIPHIQSLSFLSYRCADILASNAVLLNKGKLNKYYDPKGLIPYFTSPQEARRLAQEILSNPNKRQDITSYCHEVVEQRLRFEHRLKELEDLLSIKLLKPHIKGKYVFLEPDDFLFSPWKMIRKISEAVINFTPSSLIEFTACNLAFPIRRIIPEDIKRMYYKKKYYDGN